MQSLEAGGQEKPLHSLGYYCFLSRLHAITVEGKMKKGDDISSARARLLVPIAGSN